VRDGKLYGRGAADMKSGVAAMLYGVRALEQAGRFPGAVKVCLLSDEEGMMLGAKHLAASTALADVDGAIICEPEGGEVCPVAKGAIRLRIELTGTMAHGAMPERGRNPVPVLGRVLTVLDDLERVLQREHGEHEHLGKTYVTPTVALAGSAEQMNVLPSTATVWVDVRTIPGVDHGALIENVRRGGGRVARTARRSAGDDGRHHPVP
jgi:succinyl-diaminopimelate desuccinylase